jgi:hypothetical protein
MTPARLDAFCDPRTERPGPLDPAKYRFSGG